MHFLFLQLVREMGKRKTLYLSNKHLPWLDEEQTLPLLMSVTRWHHVLRKKLSPITTKPLPLLLRHRESPSCSHSNHWQLSHTAAGKEVRAGSDLNTGVFTEKMCWDVAWRGSRTCFLPKGKDQAAHPPLKQQFPDHTCPSAGVLSTLWHWYCLQISSSACWNH